MSFLIKKNRKLYPIIFYFFNFVFCQYIPQEFYQNHFMDFSYDRGNNWELLSSLSSNRYNHKNTDKYQHDKLYANVIGGLRTYGNATSIYFYTLFKFKENLYGYLYPRIVNDPLLFKRFTGIPREISRFSFNSGETDLSGIGYENNWLLFQIGRGRESWGAGNDIQLALNHNSGPYDYFLLASDYGQVRVRYIHGFLGSNLENFNSYLTARGIEYTNKENFLISISEKVVYSGLNRSIDFSYLNPISTHLEIELNNRLNSRGYDGANAVWQLSLDWFLFSKVRASFNLLYDEFVIDQSQIESGKEHGKAYSCRLALPYNIKNLNIFFFSSYIYVGTPVFRHLVGTNNFINRNIPLGWQHGSDGHEFTLGINTLHNDNFMMYLKFGRRDIGSESITSRPYDSYKDYTRGNFPSGIVDKKLFLDFDIKYWFRTNMLGLLYFEVENNLNGKVAKSIGVGIDVRYGKKFNNL